MKIIEKRLEQYNNVICKGKLGIRNIITNNENLYRIIKRGKNKATFLLRSISSYKAPHTFPNFSSLSSAGLFVITYIIEHGKKIKESKVNTDFNEGLDDLDDDKKEKN